jgi:hypothetical protein
MSKPDDKLPPADRQKAAWDYFSSALTPAARAALDSGSGPFAVARAAPTLGDDEADAYAETVGELTPAAAAALAPADPGRDEEESAAREANESARWGLVESPNGDWAVLRTFKTVEGLARRVGQLNGDDTVVWAFYGVPLALSRGPQRFLLLPGGERAVKIPLADGLPAEVVPASAAVGARPQDDGFLGPNALSVGHPPPEPEKKKKVTAAVDDDEEDDD